MSNNTKKSIKRNNTSSEANNTNKRTKVKNDYVLSADSESDIDSDEEMKFIEGILLKEQSRTENSRDFCWMCKQNLQSLRKLDAVCEHTIYKKFYSSGKVETDQIKIRDYYLEWFANQASIKQYPLSDTQFRVLLENKQLILEAKGEIFDGILQFDAINRGQWIIREDISWGALLEFAENWRPLGRAYLTHYLGQIHEDKIVVKPFIKMDDEIQQLWKNKTEHTAIMFIVDPSRYIIYPKPLLFPCWDEERKVHPKSRFDSEMQYNPTRKEQAIIKPLPPKYPNWSIFFYQFDEDIKKGLEKNEFATELAGEEVFHRALILPTKEVRSVYLSKI